MALNASAAIPQARILVPNLESNIERPLRYRPEDGDFVIVNGGEFFNRPLYGGNTGFRVDAGDLPEFSLYLPGKGGNVRLGVKTAARTVWLHEAERVVARYRPGMMLYEITDTSWGVSGKVMVEAIALAATEGLGLQLAAHDLPEGAEFVWAYGGASGKRGVRDGDIGTEKVPISQYFQLEPAACRGNRIEISAGAFALRSSKGVIGGAAPEGATLGVADARAWTNWDALWASRDRSNTEELLPVLVGRVAAPSVGAVHLLFQRLSADAASGADLAVYQEVSRVPEKAAGREHDAAPGLAPLYDADAVAHVVEKARQHFASLRRQIAVDTPDPYLNAAVGALNIAADAVWDDPQQVVMHGAIAWRTRLLGWRGPYAMDALGWHERARRHLSYWAGRQNTEAIPAEIPPADVDANLARNEAALHSNGDLSNSHYDMNLVYIDALFRHLAWTGDLEFAREVWPVIQRHLAWEQRLFRREFGSEGQKRPLYEAYAAIWASDDLQYHGGGVTHASAYNLYHHREAARLAKALGHDGSAYAREAQLIGEGMRRHLWLPEQGSFAEFKDLLGRQAVHPSAALWTFYHTLDSGVATPAEASQMAEYVLTHARRLPVRGPGVPDDREHAVFASTDWMPYTWSINNVVMGENVHTALGLWQAGRSKEAYDLTKSALLAAMYMGICPGNVGSMSYLDVYRRESQRDFADGSGVLSRALVEGLFGLRPDALGGEVRIVPGWPETWERASLQHPLATLAYSRSGDGEEYRLENRFKTRSAPVFDLPVRGTAVKVKVDGKEVAYEWIETAGAPRRLRVRAPARDTLVLSLAWSGNEPPEKTNRSRVRAHELTSAEAGSPAATAAPGASAASRLASGRADLALTDWTQRLNAAVRQNAIDLTGVFNDRVTEIFRKGKYVSPRSPYASLALPAQGIGGWAGGVNAFAEIDDTGLRAVADGGGGGLAMPNGLVFRTPGKGGDNNIAFVSQWDNYPGEIVVPLSGRGSRVYLLMAGSTNAMQSRLDNGEVLVSYEAGGSARLALHNPTTWWPIEQDFFVDDYAFGRPEPLPPRVNLKSGEVRLLRFPDFKGKGGSVPGGAATVLELQIDPTRELRSLTVRALANEVVIGLMAVTVVSE